jgi:hypothetical protein
MPSLISPPPLKEAFKVLVANGDLGYYGFELEKRWHHEIEDPEVVFRHYAKVIRQYLTEAGFKA